MARKKPAHQREKAPTRHAHEVLRKSGQYFRELVEHSLTGISILQDGKVIYRNPEQQRMFGPLPQGGEPGLYDNIHPDDIAAVKKLYADLTAGRVEHPGMVVRFLPRGSPDGGERDVRWLHCRASIIKYEGSDAVLLNMMDVTVARELEHVLAIQDRMTSLGHVAAGIAHEIRNPLSGITIYLHALRKIIAENRDAQQAFAVIDKMCDASRRIEAVIKRVMDFSRPGEPRFAFIDIRIPIEEALSLSEVTLRKSGILVQTDIPDEIPPCRVDSQLIEQVMLNLITNAAEAMKDSDRPKKISISLSLDGNRLKISVGDSGPGVAPARRDKIFDPFYTTKSRSTGIGLSLSHRIIMDHGGGLTVGTSPLGGAEFAIFLPMQQGARES